MSILNSISFFGLFGSSTKSKHDCLRIPISTVLKRQPFSSTPQRVFPNKSTGYQQQQHRSTMDSNMGGPQTITEKSILSSFPRPNLMPTLHSSLFGSNNNNTKCTNCSGPHSTEFCPC
jgi:hypothetical protein